jgi:hypothetical protein
LRDGKADARERAARRRIREEYDESPLYTALVDFAGAAGTIIGALTVIFLVGEAGHGLAAEVPLAAILIAVIAVNVGLRLRRRQWRRAHTNQPR